MSFLKSLIRPALLVTAGGLMGWLHAPHNIYLIMLLSVPVLLWQLEGRNGLRAFISGWQFGFGYYLFGTYWIASALFVDIAQFWWALPLAVAGLPVAAAIYLGLACWLTQKLGHNQPFKRALLLAVLWASADWLRGHLFTGFSFLLPAYLWNDAGMVRDLAALLGAYGLSLWTLLLSALPYVLWRSQSLRGKLACAGMAALLLAGAAAWSGFYQAQSETNNGQLSVRVVQPNIAQTLKMDGTARSEMLAKTLHYSDQVSHIQSFTPQLVIWPESALPYLLDANPAVAKLVTEKLPKDSYLLTGITRRFIDSSGTRYGFANSLIALDATGTVKASYDKAHLVPFGEYIPLRNILPFDPVAGGVDFTAGPGPRTLQLDRVAGFSPLICYESVFPAAVANKIAPPSWLLNISNDGWYGLTHGPYQLLQMARLRAVEEGIPMVRAANTGISAIISARGEIVAELPLGQASALDYSINLTQIATLYKKYRDMPFFVLTMFLFVAIILWKKPTPVG
jgi:apolipoprotein N-acyltransferase